MAEGRERTPRSVEIRPPSVRAETLNILKVATAVGALVAAYVAGGDALTGRLAQRAPDRQSAQPSLGLMPYQQLVRDAPPREQRMFSALQEGLLEAERIRTETGRWPDATTLADEGIPPFAPDPTRPIHYKWTSIRQDWAINYLGVPSDQHAPAWLLVILEPEPGAPADPAPNDETHHRLPDGTTLHVSIWNLPEAKRRGSFAALRLPQNEGWQNLLVGSNEQ